jgi:hypothetical protein
VAEVLDRAVPPTEIRRRYGLDVPETSVVLVVTAPRSTKFGQVRVLVESEPVIVALVPGLKALFGDA